LFRPVILMPKAILDKMSPDNLKAVLIHELAHIKRGDLWVNALQTILQVIYFYNPFVWLANAIVRRIREQAVDEMVLVALGSEAKSYSNTLIDIAEMAFWRANLSLRLIGVAESKKSLERRIKHMLTRPIPKSAKVSVFGLLSIMVMATVLLPMAAAANKEKEKVMPKFSAALSNGVTVELVGICNWPKEGKRCWRPDGSTLAEKIYASKGNKSPGASDFGFIFKVNGPEDLDFSWYKIEGTTGWEGSCKVIDAQDKQLEGFEAAISYMKEGQSATTIRIGIAAGPWTTITSYNGSRMNIDRHGGVLWSQAFETNNGTHIVASAQWHRDRAERIIAIDKDGKLHTTEHSSVSSGNVDQLTANFGNLKLNQIKEFQYQTRPYDWVMIRNVSLQPGVKTDVQVEVEKSDVLQVPSDKYPTIQSAVNAAKEGDTIVVKPDVQVEVGGQPNANQELTADAQSGQDKSELLKQIEIITNILIQAFNAGDIDTILSYYTDDVMSLPDQHEAAIGKGALHKLQLEAKQEGVKIHSIKGLEQQIWDCGDFIFEAGRCVMSLKSPKLRYLLSDWRKSVTVWIRQPDGSLKIKLDSWNPDVIPDANAVFESAMPVVTMVAGSAPSDSDMEAIYTQIKQKESTFHKTFIDHDAEAAIQFYTDDAVIMSWGKDAIRGKANIFSDIKKSMSDEPLVDMTQHVVHIEGNDKMLFAVNLFSWTFKDKSSGENVTLPGKGVHVWKRQKDDSWKILLDLYNPSVPMQQ
jgi:ketosteroid isomerase-like protein